MDIVLLGNEMRDALEATDERYPQSVRTSHLNQAAQLLSRQYEIRMNEFVDNFELAANTGDFLISEIEGGGLEPEVVMSIFEGVDADGQNELTEGTYQEVIRKLYDSTGEPVAFAQHGNRVYIRPIPTEAVTLRIVGFGVPGNLDSGQNEWLRIAPYAVMYRAAEIACGWLVEDNKIPFYRAQRLEQIESINIADSSRNDGPRDSTEV